MVTIHPSRSVKKACLYVQLSKLKMSGASCNVLKQTYTSIAMVWWKLCTTMFLEKGSVPLRIANIQEIVRKVHARRVCTEKYVVNAGNGMEVSDITCKLDVAT